MPPSKIRFVTACQQVLALAAVLAVLTPAANVISLDVVQERPVQGAVWRESPGEQKAHARRVPVCAVLADVVLVDLKGSGPWRAPRCTSR